MRFWFLLLAVAATLLVARGSFPLGVPGEWTWGRFETKPSVISGLILLGAIAAYVGLVWAGSRRIEQAGGLELAAWLAGLVVGVFAWLWIVQEECPSELHRLSKAGWVLYYRGPSGYFTDARASASRRGEFLSEYESLLAQGDVLHFGTHPPGLIVGYWGLMDACREVPAVAQFLEQLQPASVRRSFAEIEATSGRSPQRLSRADRQVLWMAMLVLQGAAAFTVVPLYFHSRPGQSREASWWSAALWGGVPAVAIFLPKSDVLLALVGAGGLAIWLGTLRARTRAGSLVGGAISGAVFWLGMCISLAIMPIGLAACLFTGWTLLHARGEQRGTFASRTGAALAAATVVFLLLTALVWLAFDLNLLSVFAANYRNHAGFYASYSRTWWKWLLVNPLEFSMAAGLPLAWMALLSGKVRRNGPDANRSGPLLACGLTWLILWLSGKNSGEAARLWIVLMPWLCWLAAATIDGWLASPKGGRKWVAAALACQLACSSVLTAHVGGFFADEANVPVKAVGVAAEGPEERP